MICHCVIVTTDTAINNPTLLLFCICKYPLFIDTGILGCNRILKMWGGYRVNGENIVNVGEIYSKWGEN